MGAPFHLHCVLLGFTDTALCKKVNAAREGGGRGGGGEDGHKEIMRENIYLINVNLARTSVGNV